MLCTTLAAHHSSLWLLSTQLQDGSDSNDMDWDPETSKSRLGSSIKKRNGSRYTSISFNNAFASALILILTNSLMTALMLKLWLYVSCCRTSEGQRTKLYNNIATDAAGCPNRVLLKAAIRQHCLMALCTDERRHCTRLLILSVARALRCRFPLVSISAHLAFLL